MAPVVRLDTHVVVWLFTGDVERLSKAAVDALESKEISISPLVQLELTYLAEIGRVTVPAERIVTDLSGRLGLTISGLGVSELVREAAALSWTRDPFDRLIVADAVAAGCPLVTKDAEIRRHTDVALW